ncbi:hypothetical protein BD289DRAFT_91401 [Coniella lustricola]|uniref:Uncharacterized protein n=1 Tax=Coniella lustricola TaxID=2025994 RepID=A0A2T3AH34_9PEZI|nr:hypothetical protein BD289DRAFT_91401 [Coniella lustricola]
MQPQKRRSRKPQILSTGIGSAVRLDKSIFDQGSIQINERICRLPICTVNPSASQRYFVPAKQPAAQPARTFCIHLLIRHNTTSRTIGTPLPLTRNLFSCTEKPHPSHPAITDKESCRGQLACRHMRFGLPGIVALQSNCRAITSPGLHSFQTMAFVLGSWPLRDELVIRTRT